MGEVIKPHSFEEAKQHIQTFSSRTSSDVGLKKVNSSELFGLFDHKVTGKELNKLASQVQDYLIKFNGLHIDFIKEFGQVYKALESLDKEYIPAILSAVNGAEEASNQAKAAQTDIRKTIETQKKVIDILSEFKRKLDQYKHLENIDDIWKDMKDFEREIRVFNEKVGDVAKELAIHDGNIRVLTKYKDKLSAMKHIEEVDAIWELSSNNRDAIAVIKGQIQGMLETIDKNAKAIASLQGIIKRLDSIEHLYEVDAIWSDTQSGKERISSLEIEIESVDKSLHRISQKLDVVQAFKSDIDKQKHLRDIDIIWNDLEFSKKEILLLQDENAEKADLISKLLEEFASFTEFRGFLEKQKHLYDMDEMWNGIDNSHKEIGSLNEIAGQNKQELDNLLKRMDEEREANQTTISTLKKNILLAYIVAGSAVGISILGFMLNVLGII